MRMGRALDESNVESGMTVPARQCSMPLPTASQNVVCLAEAADIAQATCYNWPDSVVRTLAAPQTVNIFFLHSLYRY